MSKSVLDAA